VTLPLFSIIIIVIILKDSWHEQEISIHWVLEALAIGHVADHSPSGTEVKNMWICTFPDMVLNQAQELHLLP
jgi:hypothetical protein